MHFFCLFITLPFLIKSMWENNFLFAPFHLVSLSSLISFVLLLFVWDHFSAHVQVVVHISIICPSSPLPPMLKLCSKVFYSNIYFLALRKTLNIKKWIKTWTEKMFKHKKSWQNIYYTLLLFISFDFIKLILKWFKIFLTKKERNY